MLRRVQEWNSLLSRMSLPVRDLRLPEVLETRWMSRCVSLWRCHALLRKKPIVQLKKRKR